MTLAIGTQLGPYEILSPLGAGGMGEVYRARDTRLDREVAVKVLPPRFAEDGERVARFQREAKLLASLNHPNIAAIYGLEESGGATFLVLELVEGQTLAEALHGGPLPVDEALRAAKQIAEALEAAHEQGVIHRDLKPGNVKLTPDGKVKVLDFGLAKAMAEDPSASDPAASPTITAHYTRPGVVLGTAAYMSPEQARGRPVDKRTDIWSFGVLVYECLTGRRPFEGETGSDLVARILEREPDWSALPADTPPLVQLMLRRCLAKDRTRRLRDIGDARVDLESALGDPATSGILLARGALAEAVPGRRVRTFVAWAMAVAAATVGVVIGYGARGFQRADASAVVRFSIRFPESEGVRFANSDDVLAVALDRAGTTLAYAAYEDDVRRIFVRPLASAAARALPGTEGGLKPFFSPDGRWVGFFAGKELIRAPVSGGPPLTLCDAAPASAAWLDDGTIVFTADNGATIQRVAGSGGRSETLARSDREARVPGREQLVLGFDNVYAVPGASYVLASVWDGVTIEDYDVVAVSLDDGTVRHVVPRATQPQLAAPDLLIFHREGSLFSVPFDAKRAEVTGEAALVLKDVQTSGWADAAQCAVATNGTLAYVPGGRRGPGRRLVRVDAAGKRELLMHNPDSIVGGMRISPDGGKVAVLTLRRKIDLWEFDLSRRSLTLVNSEGETYCPVWLPGGDELVYQQLAREPGPAIVRRSTHSLAEAPLFTGPAAGKLLPSSVSPDGTVLLLTHESASQQQRDDLVTMDLVEGGPPEPLLATGAAEASPMFSPDGKWFAYESDETGLRQVYVRAFPDTGRRWQVSAQGGYAARWSGAGDKLYFVHSNAMFMSSINTENGFTAGQPEKLFELTGIAALDVWNLYDVLPDGSFLMVQPADWESAPPRIEVVVNWAAELRAP
jgi:Tol biopolymer transport system component